MVEDNITGKFDDQIFNALSTLLSGIKIWEGALCGSTTEAFPRKGRGVSIKRHFSIKVKVISAQGQNQKRIHKKCLVYSFRSPKMIAKTEGMLIKANYCVHFQRRHDFEILVKLRKRNVME